MVKLRTVGIMPRSIAYSLRGSSLLDLDARNVTNSAIHSSEGRPRPPQFETVTPASERLCVVGRGIHEELIAYVADQEGYFEDEGIHVALHDGTRWKTERLRTGATIGLGRALLSRLTDGIQWSVLIVNTHRLLFWFLGRGEVKSMDDLRGRRLAVHEAHTARGCFARIVLRKHGPRSRREMRGASPR
jgi:hypothetical protein